MKKFLVTLAALCCLSLTSCNDGNEITYSYAHIQIGDHVLHDEVVNYQCYDQGHWVSIELKNNGTIFTGLNNVVLYNTLRCPLCNK